MLRKLSAGFFEKRLSCLTLAALLLSGCDSLASPPPVAVKEIEKNERLAERATVKDIVWGPEYQYRAFCFNGTCPERRWTWCIDLQGGDGYSYTVLSAFKDMYYEDLMSEQEVFRILNDPTYPENEKRDVRSTLGRRDASTSTALDYIFKLAEAEYQPAEKKKAVEAELIKQFRMGMPAVVTYVQPRSSGGYWIFDTGAQQKECRVRTIPSVQKKAPPPEEETARPSDSDPLLGMDKSNPKSRYLMEGLSAASMFRTMLSEGFLTTGSWPVNNAAAGLSPPEHYKTAGVESITVSTDGSNGIITIRYGNKVDPIRNTLLLTSKGLTEEAFVWKCVSPPGNGVEEVLLPQACRAK